MTGGHDSRRLRRCSSSRSCSPTRPTWRSCPAMVLGGIGMAITMTPMTAAALSAVPVDKAGVGSGMLNTFRQVGGALGIAVMGAILASGSKSALADGAHAGGRVHERPPHALYVAAVIAFAGALAAARHGRSHARSRASESEAARACRGGMSSVSAAAAACGRAPIGDRRGGAPGLRLGELRRRRRRPRSPAPRGSRSRSSTALPVEEAISGSPVSTRPGGELRVAIEAKIGARSEHGSRSRRRRGRASPWCEPVAPELVDPGGDRGGRRRGDPGRTCPRGTCARCTTSSPR